MPFEPVVFLLRIMAGALRSALTIPGVLYGSRSISRLPGIPAFHWLANRLHGT